jgi:hypothetical protein
VTADVDVDAAVERDELQEARAAARRSEQELGLALARLERSIRDPFAVGRRIEESPALWLAGAFVIGFILGRTTANGRE